MPEIVTPAPSTGVSFWPRAAARLLDTGILMVFAFGSGIVGAVVLAILQLVGLVDDGWLARMEQDGPWTYLFGTLAGIAYHALCESMSGATLGKLALGLRVTTLDGGRASFGKALGRSFAAYIDLLFFGLVGWSSMSQSPLRQRYGDKWAGTLVVSQHDAGIKQRRQTGQVVLGVALAFVVACAFDVAGLVLHAM